MDAGGGYWQKALMADEPSGHLRPHHWVGTALSIALLGATHLGAEMITRGTATEPASGWFALALSMAVMTVAGIRLWPGVALGALGAGMVAGTPFLDALVFALIAAAVTAGGARVIRVTAPSRRDFADPGFAARFLVGFVLLPATALGVAAVPANADFDLTAIGTHIAAGVIALIACGALSVALSEPREHRPPLTNAPRVTGLAILGALSALVLGAAGGVAAIPAVMVVATPILCWPVLRGETTWVGIIIAAIVWAFSAGSGLGPMLGVAAPVGPTDNLDALAILSAVGALLTTTVIAAAVIRRRNAIGAGAERSARHYASLVDGIDEAMFLLDANGRLAFVNRAWEAVTGHSRAASLGRPLREFLQAPSDRHLPPLLDGSPAGGTSTCADELVLTHASGGMRSVAVHVRRDERYGVLGSLHDISDSRAEVARVEDQLRGAAESLNSAAARLQLLHALTRIDPTRGDTDAVVRRAMRCIMAARVFGPQARTAVAMDGETGLRLVGADLATTHTGVAALVERARVRARGVATEASGDCELRAVALRRTDAVWLVELSSTAASETTDPTFVASVADQLDTLLGSCLTDVALRSERLQHERLRLQITALSRRMLEVQEDERHRIARELHDELGQWLVGLQAETAHLLADADFCGRETLTESAQSIHQSAARIYDVTHALMSRLRPPLLDELGLEPAIDELVWRARDGRGSVPITASLDALLDDIEAPLDIHVYRIVQEALLVAANRLEAGAAYLRLSRSSPDLPLRVEVRCEGVLTRPRPGAEGRLETDALRERVRAVGGELSVSADAGKDALIVALIPCSAQNPADEADISSDHRLAY